jgi:glycosyltransferase involved in cell wall biosynthesis
MPVPVTAPTQSNGQRLSIDLPAGRFIWLFTFDMHSVTARKNPHAVISAFRKAFGEHSQQAHLVIKANHTEEYPTAAAELRANLASVGGTLIDRTIDRAELVTLFAMCDGYISLHRSEGFGLTMAEAMAHGKPVVATGYSGNMQFMNAENSYPVRYSIVEIDRAHGPYPAGHRWAEPDIDHAAEIMAHIVRNPEEAKQHARTAAEDIRRQYAPEIVAKSIIMRIEQVVCAPN